MLIGALGTACTKDYIKGFAPETVVVSSVNELNFPQEGATQEISFPAGDGSWSVDEKSYDSSWLSVVRDGSVLKVTAQTNPNGLERRTELVVSLAGGQKVIPIFQYGTEISLRILEDKTTLAFTKDGGDQALTIKTNGTDWTISTLGDTESWYSYDINKETGKLTFTTLAMDKDDKDAKRSRRKTFYISSGNKHLEISVMQRGFAQFQRPIPFNLNGPMTEEYILTKEQEIQGGVRFTDLEDSQESWVKDQILLMQPMGAQVSYLAYVFDDERRSILRDVYIKAHPKGKFEEGDLIDWLQDDGYKKRDNVDERYGLYDALAYYKEEDDRTSYFRIVNQEDASFAPFILSPLTGEGEEAGAQTGQGAYMRYNESSNDLQLNDRGGMSSFPTHTNILSKEGFTYDDVVAFEAKRGMVPAGETLPDGSPNNITKRLNIPEVPYAHVLFMQKEQNDTKGKLKYVIYSFNYSEADENEGLSREPRLQGTVGKRIDHYFGNDIAFRTVNWNGEKYYIQYDAEDAIASKAYSLVRGDADYGFYTYIRGEEDLINITAGVEWFKVEYMKNKHFVSLAKKGKAN